MNNILVWQNNEAIIHTHDTVFTSTTKPVLSFAYDELYCEQPTSAYFYTAHGRQFSLTDEQIQECLDFCEDFYSNGDYNVYAYDPIDYNLFKGFLLKSECVSKGYKYVVDKAPENLTASWNEISQEWITYYAVITENGTLIKDIATTACDKCVVFLTKEEFHKLPIREHDTDSWDFTTETWVDKRDLAQLRKNSILKIRNSFEAVRWKAISEFVPVYEQDTWRIQLAEAQAFLELGSEADTPYIDTFLNERSDITKPSKAELVQDILENHALYVKAMARVNAKQWDFMKAIDTADTGYTVDAVMRNMHIYVQDRLSV